VVTSIEHRIRLSTFDPEPVPELNVNDIGVVRLRTAKPLVFDGYTINRLTGSFVLIEQGTNLTVGAGMLFPPTETVKPDDADFTI
jgi:bifunctional enzyme CysN/CysC/sulfate adenylyltransferase subunit 1